MLDRSLESRLRKAAVLVCLSGASRVIAPADANSTPGFIHAFAGSGRYGDGGDGGPALSAEMDIPSDVEIGPSGTVFIIDFGRIRQVDSHGIIGGYAGKFCDENGPVYRKCDLGDGGLATEAWMWPYSLGFATNGDMLVADGLNRIRRIDHLTGIITTIAGNGTRGFSGDGAPATEATMKGPGGVVQDSLGNIYFSDSGNHRIRKIAPDGIITTIAGDGWHDSYFVGRFQGDGGPATQASLNYPSRLLVDDLDNLYVADSANHRIRRIDRLTGVITTFAGGGPLEATRVEPLRAINYSIGLHPVHLDGVPATASTLSTPLDIEFDSRGNLYIADGALNSVYKVDAATKLITTLAGINAGPAPGWIYLRTDDVPANATILGAPKGLAVDASGNIYLSESFYNVVRKIDAIESFNLG